MFKEKAHLECPVCGSKNVYWTGHYYVSLQCDDCKFEVYPEDEFASEEQFIDEWNSYVNIDELIKLHEDDLGTKKVLVSKKKQLEQFRKEHEMLRR